MIESILIKQATDALILTIAYIFSVTVAGGIAAWIAYTMGYEQIEDEGLLNFNPSSHINFFGLLLFITLGVGFGNFVRVQPDAIEGKGRWPRIIIAMFGGLFAHMMMAAVGFLLAIGLFKAAVMVTHPSSTFMMALLQIALAMIGLNIMLSVVELIANGFRFIFYAAGAHDREEYAEYISIASLVLPIVAFLVWGQQLGTLVKITIIAALRMLGVDL